MPATKLIISLTLFFSTTWFAQGVHPTVSLTPLVITTQTESESPPQDANRKSSESTEVVDRALEVVAYAATLIPTFPQPGGQVAAYAALGNTLWRYDQRQARDYFRSAYAALEKIDIKDNPKNRQEARTHEQLKRWKSQTRRQLLNRIAQLDPDLARELADKDAEKEKAGSSGKERGLTSERTDLVFQRAYELLETDPEQAAALAHQTLAAGISPWVAQFMLALRERAPELADQLFEAALNVILSQSNPPDVMLLHLLGPYVLQAPEGGNRALTKRFLTLVAYALQAQSDASAPVSRRLSAGEQYHLARLYLPLIEQYAPELVPMMQGLLGHLYANLPAEQRERMEQQNRQGGDSTPGSEEEPEITRGTVGNIGDVASPEGTEGEAPSTEGAEGEAPSTEETESRASSTEGFIMKLRDERLRQALLDAHRTKLARRALAQDKIEEAYRLAQQIENTLKKVTLFAELGEKLARRGETDRAVAFFDRSYQLISTLGELREGAFQAFMLARTALEVNQARAFHYAQGAVTMLNRLRNAKSEEAELRRELARRRALRGQLEAIFIPLGRADFEQAIYVAMQLQDPEQRVLAEIAACRPVLEQAEKRESQEAESTETKTENQNYD